MSLLLSCLFDHFHDFIVEVDLLDSRVHLALPLLDICIAGCSFLLHCASPRTSPCLGRRPLLPADAMFFSCLLLALLLCLLLALLFSFLFIIAPDCSCSSRCPRTRVALLPKLSPQARGLWFCLGFSPLLGCGSFCAFFSSLVLWLWCCLCFSSWLVSGFPPNITTQHCALRD